MPAKHVAIVPARMGSKSIKDKNLTKLNSKSLIRITLDKLFDSKIFHTVVLTTDYPKSKMDVGDVSGTGYTKFEFIKRPAELAQDDTPMVDVIEHTMKEIGNEHTFVWLFQPTCPFTRIEDMYAVKDLLEKKGAKSVITFKEVKEHSNRFYTMKDKETFTEAYRMRYTNFTPRQKLMPQFIRSGNIYATSRVDFLKTNSLETKPIGAHFVDRVVGLNIDEHEDLVLVKYWLSLGRVKIEK